MKLGRRQILVAIAIVAVLAAGALFRFGAFRFGASPQDLTLFGNIDIREADLAFNAPGRVDRMLVEEGDHVEAGTLLATLEADIFEAEAAAARARLGAQRAALDRLLAGSRPEEIREAQANVRAIEAELEDARANLERTRRLAETDFASRQKLDDDRARVKSLEAQLAAAQQMAALAVQGPRIEDIAEARALVKAREAELALAEQKLDYTKLRAKTGGVVKTRIVEPGAVALANAPIYTIAISDPVWVRTYVSEPDLGRVRPGLKAQVMTDSAPDKPYDGWIGYVSPTAEFTPKSVETPELRTSLVYGLRVYVKNPDGDLRQGMPVTVRISSDAAGEDAASDR